MGIVEVSQKTGRQRRRRRAVEIGNVGDGRGIDRRGCAVVGHRRIHTVGSASSLLT